MLNDHIKDVTPFEIARIYLDVVKYFPKFKACVSLCLLCIEPHIYNLYSYISIAFFFILWHFVTRREMSIIFCSNKYTTVSCGNTYLSTMNCNKKLVILIYTESYFKSLEVQYFLTYLMYWLLKQTFLQCLKL